MTTIIAVRLTTALAGRLRRLGERTGRPVAHIVRYLLGAVRDEDLPRAWFEAAREEQIATGRADVVGAELPANLIPEDESHGNE